MDTEDISAGRQSAATNTRNAIPTEPQNMQNVVVRSNASGYTTFYHQHNHNVTHQTMSIRSFTV